jgi:CheY-like chemotaxis protein
MPNCVGSYQRFGSVRIEVSDEGPGITQQGKAILFQEGVQLDPNQLQSGQGLFAFLFSSAFSFQATPRIVILFSNFCLYISTFFFPIFTGSGLGLWISKGITRIHGGIIGVDSEELAKGSMFYVELPLIEGLETSARTRLPPSHPQNPHSFINESSVDVNGNIGEDSINGESRANGVVKRTWSWKDPRNNIDHKHIITPTSKFNSPQRLLDSRIHQSHKVIPLDLTVIPVHEAVGARQEILSQKPFHPFSSETANNQMVNLHSTIPQVLRPSLRILVVDDVKSIRKLFARALSNQGHTCDTACDGQECVDLFMKQQSEGLPSSSAHLGSAPVPVTVCPYDLVLIDSEMPVMNGPIATKIIRSLGFKELVILGVTGNVLPEDVEMFLAHGADAVLGKPLTVNRMWEEYDRIIKDRSQFGS